MLSSDVSGKDHRIPLRRFKEVNELGVDIKSETVDCGGQSSLLVSVKDGPGIIGTCTAGNADQAGNSSSRMRLFYIGNDPVINLLCPGRGNKRSDKLVSFSPGFVGYDVKINGAITNSFNKLNEGESLVSGLRDIFNLLEDGVYTVYFSDYYPTDGNGIFFWGGYNIPHEVRGTAEFNRVIGDRTFKPCFLLPTQPLDYYAGKVKMGTDGLVKKRRVQGIVYHVTGLFSALLKGHHGAASCADLGVPFRCAVIEKIAEPYTDKIFVAPPVDVPPATVAAEDVDPEAADAAEQIEAAAESAPAPVPEPVAVTPTKGITGFRSPSVKIPLESFPKDMLRQLIEGRSEYKPDNFNVIAAKLQTVRKKSINNNVLPITVLERAEQMPDCEMVESAFAIDKLTDEQLDCLLRGDVECNGNVIISPNFYSSIVTACSFLQFKDTKRFVDFSIAIMENPELSAAHDYAARRVSTQVSNKKIYSFFKNAVDSGDSKYDRIIPIAQTFIKHFKPT